MQIPASPANGQVAVNARTTEIGQFAVQQAL
jgi:hypothetical protein